MKFRYRIDFILNKGGVTMEKWEAIDITNEVSVDVDMFEFACCGSHCGGGQVVPS